MKTEGKPVIHQIKDMRLRECKERSNRLWLYSFRVMDYHVFRAVSMTVMTNLALNLAFPSSVDLIDRMK